MGLGHSSRCLLLRRKMAEADSSEVGTLWCPAAGRPGHSHSLSFFFLHWHHVWLEHHVYDPLLSVHAHVWFTDGVQTSVRVRVSCRCCGLIEVNYYHCSYKILVCSEGEWQALHVLNADISAVLGAETDPASLTGRIHTRAVLLGTPIKLMLQPCNESSLHC